MTFTPETEKMIEETEQLGSAALTVAEATKNLTRTFTQVKDSGKREEFSTGSRRDTRDGKGRYDLISPIALKRLAQHYENGAKKYGDRNWEKGQPCSRYLDSLIRHAFCVAAGQTDEDHLSAIAWNAFAIIHTQARMPELDDLPKE